MRHRGAGQAATHRACSAAIPTCTGRRSSPASRRSWTDSQSPTFADRARQAAGAGRLARPTARNPLTARVMVNRLWQYHFGRGIVPTPNDFGLLGEPPTHPELLDWLAAEFMDGGWRIKRHAPADPALERLPHVVARQRQGAGQRPGQPLFWRFPMRRLAAEEIRDSILAVSGSSEPQDRRARASTRPFPARCWPASRCRATAGRSRRPTSGRRSVYVHVKRSLLVPILASSRPGRDRLELPGPLHDDPADAGAGMLNGEFANKQAAAFAERLRRERPGRPGQAGPPGHLPDHRRRARRRRDPPRRRLDRGARPRTGRRT